jgi:hypothetical protein
MSDRAWELVRAAWPFVGWAYLVHVALQPPPARYVGIVGVAIVTPLLLGWTAGKLLGIGPWAASTE